MGVQSPGDDGQNPGQEVVDDPVDATEGDDAGQVADKPRRDRYGDLEARMELLSDGITELRNAVLESRRQAAPAPAVEEEINDDEPLTASKVSRIVQKNLNQVVNQSNNLTQRQVWDDKAKQEFPLSDPKFLREFKQTWREQVESGLDPTHPRAIYNVAKTTALALKAKGEQPARRQAAANDSPEVSAARGDVRQTSRPSRTPKIADDDPRVRFYTMSGKRTKAQIERMKAKLADRDSTRKATR